ncbi:DNA-binding response regulator [Thomasclavelia cocleata]|uniref:DNA-binding response regulator, OmpR family, contains REC and winged-helix (WHTH) domain n=1 Tax=Thomasclavelia cocleata TaxID=69824 RepID=A0A1I0F1Z2_9FIRM|nr:response regulator transcription factor [Thomasclavelia cocleata]MCR1960666.1 response regulator transcription factor [Thomasclavelia cocleata]NDO41340.1 response regulator transcription factor [Thomasclavelia cocleata]PJN81786.1 DNA-binding response regulator [Thomasclavelia cocleata]SET52017.1 DNA-binding response regulator, OmpR family, contains REC and winged-helix (wHTH) domain [Thomasclavelia cocleata]
MVNNKILIADDNPEIREVLNVLLSSEGYDVIEAKDGQEAIELISSEIDLYILDIMMPVINGYQACIEIRKKSNAPILFLTAKSQESDKTLGFSSGGDDYLSKPFSYNELTTRVKALLRRYYIYQGKVNNDESTENKIIYNNIVIDPNNEIVFLNNEQIELTYIEYQILYLLLSNRKHIYSTQSLYENIWNEPYYYSANNTIMVHIRNLRKKIETDPQNPKVIKTIWGKGYRCD